MNTAKLGRNDLCRCGSGLKFKRCCEAKTASARTARFWMIVVAAAVVLGVAAGIASFSTDGSGSGGARLWSEDHGHYHDASGVAVP
jgi:hypothetical protein